MTEYTSDFSIDKNTCYLNHAAVSPWPDATAARIKSFADENRQYGAMQYPEWLKVEQGLRDKIRRLLNAPAADDIALVKNTSEALSMVAYGLEWQRGDNIVIAQQEFPSNRIVWQSLNRFGVKTKLVDLYRAASPEEALINAMDSNTRLLSVSSVQYGSGLRMDLKRLGQACKAREILFCIDAIQSLGALALDVQDVSADFVMADGHKWLASPEGLGLFYCHQSHRKRLKLIQFGWHMVEQYMDYDSLEWMPAETARRFECGSPNMLGIHALDSSLELLLNRQIEQIEQRVIANSRYLLERLTAISGIEIVSDIRAGRLSGIVAFRHADKPSGQIYRELMQHCVICALREGNIRFSPHYYTSTEVLDRSIELLKQILRNL